MSARHRRGTGAVKGGRYLDNVAANDVDTGNVAQDDRHLGRGQPAPDRRAGAGRIGRIQAVDIKAQINRVIAQDLLDLFGNRRWPLFMHHARIQRVHAQRIFVGGANAHLNRPRRIDDPGFTAL